MSAYRDKHRLAILIYDQLRRLANIDEVRARESRYNEAHREERNAYYRRHYRENREQHYLKCKNWRFKNRDLVRAKNLERHALKKSAEIGDQSVIIAWEKRWRSKPMARCFWCNTKAKSSECETEHIVPLSKGGKHAIENLCVSCAKCNQKKHDHLPEKWNGRIDSPVLL